MIIVAKVLWEGAPESSLWFFNPQNLTPTHQAKIAQNMNGVLEIDEVFEDDIYQNLVTPSFPMTIDGSIEIFVN